MADFNFLDIVGGEFAEQILAEIIAQGISGEELLKQFKVNQSKVRPAVEALINEAEEVVRGNGEYFTYDDILDNTCENS